MVHGSSEDGLFLMGQSGLLCHTPGELRALLVVGLEGHSLA